MCYSGQLLDTELDGNTKLLEFLENDSSWLVGWLVGCFGLNSPKRQYSSLYRAVSQREGERGEKGKMRVKMSKQPHLHLLQEQ